MSNIVGFTIAVGLSKSSQQEAFNAQEKTLGHFEWLEKQSIQQGETRIDLWGRGELSKQTYRLPDGSLLVLVGSPTGNVPWKKVEQLLIDLDRGGKFYAPWDGRFVLLKVSADGSRWTSWNDWIGSIPVFYTVIDTGRIASTLEQVIVKAAGFTAEDIFLPGMLSIFIHGYTLGDWTLYKTMKVIPGDCTTEWREEGVEHQIHLTIEPTDERWDWGYDELVDGMYELSRQVIADVLETSPRWILPLSAGLDSRLIAAVGAELGVNMQAYTWGIAENKDTIHAGQIASTVGLPWKFVNLGTDFLVKYTRLWSDLFGSSMDFHGIYMISFLQSIANDPPAPLAMGFLGEANAGYDVRFMSELYSNPERRYNVTPSGYNHTQVDDLKPLFRIPIDDALEELADQIERFNDNVPGPWFQQLRYVTLWNRMRLFTNFQSTLCDYWRGVGVPYMSKEYSQFCMSLPRAVLEERRLQVSVFRRYYPDIAAISGTYGTDPLLLTDDYVIKRRVGQTLPKLLRRGPMREFAVFAKPRSRDQDSVQAFGKEALWPIWESRERLSEWVDFSKVDEAYEATLRGERRGVMMLKGVQTLAYRLMENEIVDS
jgi:hypothetical protein